MAEEEEEVEANVLENTGKFIWIEMHATVGAEFLFGQVHLEQWLKKKSRRKNIRPTKKKK